MTDPTSRPLSARAQAILERVEREARADPAHGLTRPQPPPAPPAPSAEPDAATTAQLLALVNALAQRTEVARRQLEELTTALDALMTDLSAPGALVPPGGQAPRTAGEPAAPPAVRWPADLR